MTRHRKFYLGDLDDPMIVYDFFGDKEPFSTRLSVFDQISKYSNRLDEMSVDELLNLDDTERGKNYLSDLLFYRGK
ncbi:hypothetical protein DRJ25_05270 [Candidatus Woesearchaeota archaeon]|nr:MAG: hypothetical protein DRJ25_05270 [Candidatus Woesearchaeota archaeon]